MIKRKSHNLDEGLLRRARKVLGARTETETIHAALRGVLLGEQVVADLRAASGQGTFRPAFVKAMRREARSR
jgi:Arc/MetJ family transcription regulator